MNPSPRFGPRTPTEVMAYYIAGSSHLKTRTVGALLSSNLYTLADVSSYGVGELICVKHLGKKAVYAIMDFMEKHYRPDHDLGKTGPGQGAPLT